MIEGNVKVEPGAALQMSESLPGAVTIGGSVQSDGAAFVRIFSETTVSGNLQIKGSTGILPGIGAVLSSGISGGSVIGNAQLEENSLSLFAISSTIGGDLQLNKNTGGVFVNNNTVGGNLQCQDNFPLPGVSAPNTVTGNTVGQCAGF